MDCSGRRVALWLAWGCLPPWRALLTWAAISIVSFYLSKLVLDDWVYHLAGKLERQINRGSLIPTGMLQKSGPLPPSGCFGRGSSLSCFASHSGMRSFGCAYP